MAAQPALFPSAGELEISLELKKLLHFRETETHYITESLAGVTIEHPKSSVQYPWQLLGGVLVGGPDPNATLETDKQDELANEDRLSGEWK
jgi:predicted alpha/beta hydrolase family esterase